MAIDQTGVDDPNHIPRLGTRSNALAYAMGLSHGGKRDYYKNFGWKRNPSVEDYYASYLKNPYFNAAIEIPAKTCWRDPPEIVDDEDSEADESTQFEKDVDDLVDATRLWHYGKRTHILSRIGEFGLLMVGWADGDGQEFADPVNETELAKNGPEDAIEWLRPFSQISVEKIRWADRDSDRWGHPEYYKIDFSDENNDTTTDLYAGRDSTQWVHHSRIIHVAPNLLDDEVRGIPPGEPIYNTTRDLIKLEGSAAESAYAIARPGISVTIDKDANASDQDKLDIYDEAADYVDEHENFMVMQGAEANRISAETVDPSHIKDSLIEALSAATKIPQKKFRGNESGEIAGAQDLREFYGTVQEEREMVAGPQIARELIERAIRYTIVDSPKDEFTVEWVPLAEQDQQEESEIHENRGSTISDIAAYMPNLSSEAIAEYIETGEFPAMEDEDDAPAPMNPAEDAGAPPTPIPPESDGSDAPDDDEGDEDEDE